MKKVILAIDSYKGTMSSRVACEQAALGIHDVYPDAVCCIVPVADGGEGTVEAFCHILQGRIVTVAVTGPLFTPVEASYAILPDGHTAVIEMAQASGLPLVGAQKNPLCTTSYGTGELIRHAAEQGCTEILLGLGGSATNDGGAGALAALGVRFCDGNGNEITPTGGGLAALTAIDPSGLAARVKNCHITLLCDVDNPLCGTEGASAVYGPQKGADSKMVGQLDRNLDRFADCVKAATGREIRSLPGGGAAGGMAAGLAGFLNVSMESGIPYLLRRVQFEKLLEGADLVITGEGRLDAQSVRGKVPAGVGMAARQAGVPAIAVVGDLSDGHEGIYDYGIEAVFSINRLARPYEEIRSWAAEDLRDAVRNLVRLWRLSEGRH